MGVVGRFVGVVSVVALSTMGLGCGAYGSVGGGEDPVGVAGELVVVSCEGFDPGVREVSVGSVVGDVGFPGVVGCVSGGGQRVEVPVVGWGSVPEFDPLVVGEYVFSPILGEGWVVDDGVVLPQVGVIVGEGEGPVVSGSGSVSSVPGSVLSEPGSVLSEPGRVLSTLGGVGVPVPADLEELVYYDPETGGVETWSGPFSQITDASGVLTSGWYYVSGVVNRGGLVVDGEVTIVLQDDADLVATGVSEAPGVRVPAGKGLTIYGASEAGAGRLIARGGYLAAGIGGGAGETSGTVTMSGGTVTAWGGDQGAGVGGGYFGGGGQVVMSGGTVTATGGYWGAGVGGGRWGGGGQVVMSGGTVTARGGDQGAGVGGGNGGGGGTVTMSGGTVTATGGIGGAGVGGSNGGAGGTVTMSGGTVHATGGIGGAGVGGGYGGGGGTVTMSGGTVTATGGNSGAGVGGGDLGGGGQVVISGGTVTATAGDGGSAVGPGEGGSEGLVVFGGGSIKVVGGGVSPAPVSRVVGGVEVFVGEVDGQVGVESVFVDGVDFKVAGNHPDGDESVYVWMTGESHRVVTDVAPPAGGEWLAHWDGSGERFVVVSSPVVSLRGPSGAVFGGDIKVGVDVGAPGLVKFFLDGATTPFASETLEAGEAEVSLPAGVGVGSHSVGGVYTNGGYEEVVTPVSFVVGKGDPGLSLLCENIPYGQAPRVEATTSGDGVVVVEYKPGLADDSAFSTTLPDSGGEWSGRARVTETDDYLSDTKECEFVVVRASSSTLLTATAVMAGQDAVVEAVVVGVLGGSVPGGFVEFRNGSSLLGTGPLVNGKASFLWDNVPAGGHGLSATYVGDGNYEPSSSGVVSFDVEWNDQVPLEFTVPAGLTWVDTSVDLVVTGGSGTGERTFRVITGPGEFPNPQEPRLSVTGVGQITVEITQGGDEYYNPATVIKTISVGEATPTISESVVSGGVIGMPLGSIPMGSVMVMGGRGEVLRGTFTWQDPTHVLTGPGVHLIRFTPGDGNHLPVSKLMRVELDQREPVITKVMATPVSATAAQLVVEAAGNGPLSYQWQVQGSWIDIPRATTPAYTYQGLTQDKSYTVRVIVTDINGNVTTSKPVTFTTNKTPTPTPTPTPSVTGGPTPTPTPTPTPSVTGGPTPTPTPTPSVTGGPTPTPTPTPSVTGGPGPVASPSPTNTTTPGNPPPTPTGGPRATDKIAATGTAPALILVTAILTLTIGAAATITRRHIK